MNTASVVSSGPPPLSARLLVRVAAWPVAAAAVVAHIEFADEGFPVESRLCAGILAAMAIVGAAYARLGTPPILPLTMVRFYFAMGFPVFTRPHIHTLLGPVRSSSRALVEASFAGVVFAICLVAAALLVGPSARRLGGDLSNVFDRRQSYTGADTIASRALAAVSLTLFVINARYGFSAGAFSLFTIILSSPDIGLGLLWWDAHQTQDPWSKMLCWVAVVLLSLTGLSTGMLGAALSPWLTAMLYAWSVNRRLPIGLVTVAMLAVLILNPVKHAYRTLSWNTGSQIGMLQRAENWGIAFSKVYGDGGGLPEGTAAGVALRMSSLMQVVHMFEWVPGRVPHDGAQAWLKVPLYFTPTLIWPGRPSPIEMHRKYWSAFKLIPDRTTRGALAVTLPSVGDGYWRLGWPGVILEGSLLGLIAGFFNGLARRGSRSLTFVGVGFIVAGGGPEGHIISMILTLPKNVIVWALVLAVLQWLPTILQGAPKTTISRARVPIKP